MRARDPELNSKWGTICPPVEMLAPDGKRRKTQVADLEGVSRIIESIPSKKAEPVRQWLAEVATTEYSRQSNPKTMAQSKRIAEEGGEVAREAKETMERRLGHSVVSPEKASDYIKPIDATPTQELPFTDMPKKEPTAKKKSKK